ncbi:DUF6705 family protein [uncultured Croceitalea sp.]|uniref:DUF6705 family protein n=1 Tax=uncultured Croceitalea sp. TaxID=1798908 RepID=UPI0033061CFD
MRCFFLIAFFSSSVLLCQKTILETPQGKYYKDKRLNDYLGTWQYNSGDKLFKIKLEPHKIVVGRIAMDIILGSYLYVKNRDTIHNSIRNQYSFKYDNSNSFGGHMENDIENNLILNFKDFSYKKNGTARIHFLNENKTKAKWILSMYEREQLRILDDSSPIIPSEGFSVPIEMILTKNDK